MFNKDRILKLVYSAMLTAIGVLLAGPLSIPAFPLGVYSLKIGLGVLPVIIAGVMFGPLYGGIVGGLVDFLQAVLFPKGPFMPWFTVVGILFGLIPGLFFIKKQKPSLKRVFLSVFTGQAVGSVLCNTLLMMALYGKSFFVLLPPRLINQAMMIPIYTVLVYNIVPILQKRVLPKEQKQ